MRMVEKSLLLQILDQQWKDHLLSLDHLRQAVGLRAYAQQDPLQRIQARGLRPVRRAARPVREAVTQVLMHVEIRVDGADLLARRQQQLQQAKLQEGRADPALAGQPDGSRPGNSGADEPDPADRRLGCRRR